MKKAGSNIISFPKPRRLEQTGLTQKGFPLRWMGLLVMTTVGAAWALSPQQSGEAAIELGLGVDLKTIVFQGEPQVVAQLMGTILGPESVPLAELKTYGQGNFKGAVVLAGKPGAQKIVVNDPEFTRAIESLEEELAESGDYPPIPTTSGQNHNLVYKVSGTQFDLKSGALAYNSLEGIQEPKGSAEESNYSLVGALNLETSGWGPWRKTVQTFAPSKTSDRAAFAWVADRVPTPAWSARMYFPVSQESTGYAFRRGDGKSIYDSGELLYDGVTGTFQLKLHREGDAVASSLAPAKLERALNSKFEGCELVGDADLLADLGLMPQKTEKDGLVKLASGTRLPLTSTRALDGLALSALGRRKTDLKESAFQLSQESTDESASVVGKMSVLDKLGQVHELRLRAGRATHYDWVVGQLCPIEPSQAKSKVVESSAYDESFERKTESTIFAGK